MSRRVALWLGIAGAADYAVQMLLPVILVRTLSPEDFGGYRLLWMSAQTAALVLSLNMAFNLIYLLPRYEREQRGALLGNALAYLVLAAIAAALVSAPLLHAVAGSGLDRILPSWAQPLFVAAWMVSLPFDNIALMAGRPLLQAAFTSGQTLTRIALIGGAAAWTRQLDIVAIGMIGLALARLAAVLVFARTSGAFPHPRLDAPLAAAQLRYGLSFGLGANLFSLRSQADGWIAAALFDPVAVATIAIAMTIVPVLGLVRQALTNATVGEVARLLADGRVDAALQINRSANLDTALLVLPLAFAFIAVAPDAMALVYTPAYAAAAQPARLYALAYAVCVVEMTTVVQALGDGHFVVRSGVVLLVLAVAAALAGAGLCGLTGIAIGSLAAMWAGSAWTIAHVAKRCLIRVTALQPWREMGWLLAVSCAAAGSSVMGLALMPGAGLLLRTVSGCAVFAAVYIVLVALLPQVRRLYVRNLRYRLEPAPPPNSSQS